jgi:hypothetical protein
MPAAIVGFSASMSLKLSALVFHWLSSCSSQHSAFYSSFDDCCCVCKHMAIEGDELDRNLRFIDHVIAQHELEIADLVRF